MVFLGGAVLANIASSLDMAILIVMLIHLQMADKENMWVSKQEWEEQGPQALQKLGSR
jgi:actin-related protein 2